MKISIVTDSTADIPTETLQAKQIHVVPNLVIIDGQNLEDGKGISRREFYERLPDMKSPPTTATASPGRYQQLYEKLFQGGTTHILSIHAASELSGIFNAVSTAAQEFGQRVSVVDSGQITLGLGFQVLEAAEAVARGSPVDAILRFLEGLRHRIRVIAMLDTLEYVRRSGRVSWARAHIGNLLRVKPFLEVRRGQVHSLGEARTRQKGIGRLKKFLLQLGTLDHLAILHTNAEADALEFLYEINPETTTKPFVVNVTTVIGTHVGPNGLGFAAVTKGQPFI
jgi:DegV family protein with EDD domain